MMNGKMSTRVIQEISDARGVKLMREREICELREKAKRVMWSYYSENRSVFSDNISEFREDIIIELMKGRTAEKVLSIFRAERRLKAS